MALRRVFNTLALIGSGGTILNVAGNAPLGS